MKGEAILLRTLDKNAQKAVRRPCPPFRPPASRTCTRAPPGPRSRRAHPAPPSPGPAGRRGDAPIAGPASTSPGAPPDPRRGPQAGTGSREGWPGLAAPPAAALARRFASRLPRSHLLGAGGGSMAVRSRSRDWVDPEGQREERSRGTGQPRPGNHKGKLRELGPTFP